MRLDHLAGGSFMEKASLRKHPFLLALRRWGGFVSARKVASGEERGETYVFAG